MGMVGVGYHHPSVQWPHPPMDERQRGNSAAVASGLKLVTASLPVTSGQSDLGVSLPSFRFPSIRSLSCSLWPQVTRSWESPSLLVLFDAYFASSVACCTPFSHRGLCHTCLQLFAGFPLLHSEFHRLSA